MNKEKIQYNVTKGRQVRKINILHPDTDLTVTDNVGDSLLHIVFTKEKPNQTRVIQILGILLDRGLAIDVKNKAKKTVLHLAIEHRYEDVIDFCIRRNADLNLIDYNGNTLGHFIVEEECRKYNHHLDTIGINDFVELGNESSSFVDCMVSRGVDFFHKRNNKNQSALDLTIELNLQPIFLTLLKHISDLSSLEKDQPAILCTFFKMSGNSRYKYNIIDEKRLCHINFYCYWHRHNFNIVKMIFEKSQSMSVETLNAALRLAINNVEPFGVIDLILRHTPKGLENKVAVVNEPYENEGTVALKLFREHPKLEMLRLLQDCGADFSRCTKDGQSFLHLICLYSNEMGMVAIVRPSCDVNAVNYMSQTLLHAAIKSGKNLIAMDLLDYGADINDERTGIPHLSHACQKGRAEIVEKLIKCGADLGYKDDSGRTLMHLAVTCYKTIEVLIKNGLDVNAQDKEGQTPLHLTRYIYVIRALINGGALVDLPDNKGHTPLYYAIKSNSTKFFELLKCGADIWEPKAFQSAISCFQNPDAINCSSSLWVMKHLVKMMAAGLLYEISYTDDKTNQTLQWRFNRCLEEVESLKSFFVDDHTSLYQLLHRNRNRRCAYADNEKLKALVEGPAIVHQFLNYFGLIIGCYNQAKSRKPLLMEATRNLEKIIQADLPDLCIDRILLYLGNVDLVGIIWAGKNS